MSGLPPGYPSKQANSPGRLPPGYPSSSEPPSTNQVPHRDQNSIHPASILGSAIHGAQKYGEAIRHTVAQTQAAAFKAWDTAKQHKVETALNVLNTPFREVGGIAENIEEHRSFSQSVDNLNNVIWHPSAAVTDRMTAAIGKGIHAASHDDINKMVDIYGSAIDRTVHHNVTSALRPYIKGGIKAFNDTAIQIVADPISIGADVGAIIKGAKATSKVASVIKNAPGAAHIARGIVAQGQHLANSPAVKPLIKAGGAAAHGVVSSIHKELTKHGAGPAFAHLGVAAKAALANGTRAHQAVKNTFTIRPDLDALHLTKDGKAVRMSIENSQRGYKHMDRNADEEAYGDADKTVARYIQYAHEHGAPVKSALAALHRSSTGRVVTKPTGSAMVGDIKATVAKIRNGTADDHEKILSGIREELHQNEVARRTKEVFNKPGNSDLTKNAKINWDDVKEPQAEKVSKIAQASANLGKAAVMYNPLPHGGKNMGTLAFLGGGIPALSRGTAAIVKGVDKATEARLHAMGAGHPDYIDRNPKGVLAPMRQASNDILSRMELGWRAGLLSHLDETLGKSAPGSKEELIKGHLLNQKLGDYHNLSAFTKFFKAAGGPFVAFHLGIVPQAVASALKENPDRVMNALKFEYNIQNNRAGKGANQFQAASPIDDGVNAAVDPLSYLMSESSLGLTRDAFDMLDSVEHPDRGTDPADLAYHLAGHYFAPIGFAEGIKDQMSGNTMPNQKMTFADHVFSELMQSWGSYYKRYESPKAASRTYKHLLKYGARDLE